jgi:hypothetical protein
MKGFGAVIFILQLFAQGGLAQSFLASSIAELPSCAITCLGTAIANSACSATNTTCTCTNESLQNQVTLCVTKDCTIIEELGKLIYSPKSQNSF